MSSASTLEERSIQRRTAQGYRRSGSFEAAKGPIATYALDDEVC